MTITLSIAAGVLTYLATEGKTKSKTKGIAAGILTALTVAFLKELVIPLFLYFLI